MKFLNFLNIKSNIVIFEKLNQQQLVGQMPYHALPWIRHCVVVKVMLEVFDVSAVSLLYNFCRLCNMASFATSSTGSVLEFTSRSGMTAST